MKIESVVRVSTSVLAVGLASLVGYVLWKYTMYSPWTRDGRVRAEVVQIAPDVAGLITEVRVHDNQTVKKGDVLFVIDPSRYRDALDEAKANLDAAVAAAHAAGASVEAAVADTSKNQVDYAMYAAQSDRRQKLLHDIISAEARDNALAAANAAKASLKEAQASSRQASATRQEAMAAVEQARAALATAQLNLSRTEVLAPTDGYVTNLQTRVGDYATAGTALVALIDQHAYWIYGYFEETKLPKIHIGDAVDIRLLAGGQHLQGRVESLARGITDADNPNGNDLLADVSPTFNWVRLAQRVPVRIAIDADHLPAGVFLAAGMTATVRVDPHEAGADGHHRLM